MGLKKFSATLKYESTGCVKYGDAYNSRGHKDGNAALIATIEKLAWLAAVAGIGSEAAKAFNTGSNDGHAHIAKHNAKQDTNDIPWAHRLKANGGYEIGYFGPNGFVKTDEAGTLAQAKSIVEGHNAA